MDRFNIPLMAEGLTAYAIEWQNGFERSAPSTYAPSWAETRRLWTDAVLQGMARLEGRSPEPALIEQFDRQLEQAQGSFGTVPASLQLQKETVRGLRDFVFALEAAGDDHGRQIALVSDLLEDMFIHRQWNFKENGVLTARDEAESALVRITAKMPIRFSRILLGWEPGPCVSGFASGSVRDADAVRETAVYDEASRQHPEMSDWPAVCVVYAGGNRETALGTVDATEFDLSVMNRTGDSFLDRQGIRWLGGPYELTVTTGPSMTQMLMLPDAVLPKTTGGISLVLLNSFPKTSVALCCQRPSKHPQHRRAVRRPGHRPNSGAHVLHPTGAPGLRGICGGRRHTTVSTHWPPALPQRIP